MGSQGEQMFDFAGGRGELRSKKLEELDIPQFDNLSIRVHQNASDWLERRTSYR